VSDEQATVGGFWSVYYYDGQIYGTEITRGLDVFELVPSDYLTANEIAAAALADTGGAFNPQQQYPVQWRSTPAWRWRSSINWSEPERRMPHWRVSCATGWMARSPGRAARSLPGIPP